MARAALVGLLAAGGPAAVEVLLVGNRLIPDAIGFPGLRRAAGLPAALHVLEAELVHRARLLEAKDTPDFASHRREHPDDPLPALVLVADGVSLEQAGRLAAILAQGPRLGVGALLPGTPSKAAPSWCWTTPAGCRPRPPGSSATSSWSAPAPARSPQAEAAELLGVLAHSSTDDDVLMRSVEPGHQDARWRLQEPAVAARHPSRWRPDPAGVAAADDPAGLSAEYGKAQALVQVRLLGAMQITTAAGELRSGLRASARELLAYYLVHPDGASLEQAVDAMWPDTELGRERERFWTALGNLRSHAAQGHRRRPS